MPLINNLISWGQFLLYCEGTRFTPKKHQISMEVAESKGLPKLKYHLLPRTKGFWVTVQNLRGTGECPPSTKCLNTSGHQILWAGCPWDREATEAFANQMSCTINCCRVSCLVAAAAVYDSTLNFRNNETPTLLGILNGKKYHADLYVRYKEMFCTWDCNASFPVYWCNCPRSGRSWLPLSLTGESL